MARAVLVAVVVFLFCGLVLPAPENDMELKLHDPSSAMVTGAHQACVALKEAPRQLILPMLPSLIRVAGLLAALVVVARLQVRSLRRMARSLLRRFDAPLRDQRADGMKERCGASA